MSQTDLISLSFTLIIIIPGLVFMVKRAHLLYDQYLLHMSEKIPDMKIIEPAKLLLPPQRPRIIQIVDRAVEHAIEQAVISTIQEDQLKVHATINENKKTNLLREPQEKEWIASPTLLQETEEDTLILKNEYECQEELLEQQEESRSLEELAESNPVDYYKALSNILCRAACYMEKYERIIKESNKNVPGFRAISTDDEDIRRKERVSQEEWIHCFQYSDGFFWQLEILTRDILGKTQLHPEYQERLDQWYEQYLAEFFEGLDETEEEEKND